MVSRRRFAGNPKNGAALISMFGEDVLLEGGQRTKVIVSQRDSTIYGSELMGRSRATRVRFVESTEHRPQAKETMTIGDAVYFVTDVFKVGDGWMVAEISYRNSLL